MRHLGSIVLALVLAPLIWGLTGIGVGMFAEAGEPPAEFGLEAMAGLAAMLGAGFCYCLLVLPRLSPLGPALAGLAFLGMTVWRVFYVRDFTAIVPDTYLGVSRLLQSPADGLGALLAVPLLGTVFSPQRWRRYELPPPDQLSPTPAYPYYQPYPDTRTLPPTPGYPDYPGSDDTWPLPDDPQATRRF